MPQVKKQSRAGRPPSGEAAKKVVSLTIDPALISQVDAYAAEKRISRSAVIEVAITGLLALDSRSPIAPAENSLVQPDSCIFASSSLGSAILY